jgi:competence protein ComFC
MFESVASFLNSETHPQRCIGCDRRASDLLCRACVEALPQIGRPVCARCGMPTGFGTFVCGECKVMDPNFESARAPLRYTGVGKQMVHSLKYRDYTTVVDRLAVPLMLSALDDQSWFVAVVPVPLHRSRLRRREFNKARLLAQGVASKIRVPVSDTIQVTRETQDQVELSAAERRANVSGAYRARGRVAGRVILIDGAFTTGATMSSCAEALLQAGAREVHALSLCRTC